MRIPVPLLAFGLVPLCACLVGPAAAQRIYQWQEAAGRTHYSSTPPSSGRYSVRGVHERVQPASTGTTSAKEPPQCASARRNLALLQGEGIVQIDSDADGKPDRALNAAERAAQAKVAESILAADCGSAAPPAAPADSR